MPNEPVLSVLLLWHQHQPFYKDPLSNRYEMPWVRLHATKDYYDMAALLDEFPKIRLNINLVPSLLLQLDDYGQGKAQDKFFIVSQKPAAELSFEDRLFMLNDFFMANWNTMIDPYPRYRELLEKRGRFLRADELPRTLNYFKEQDWRDLQVWFNLTWFDPYWTETDPFIRSLREKGTSFSEEEKKALLEKQIEICGRVVGKHKELQDRGQLEITATPFYHPILPLLCDTESSRVAMPQVTLPQHHFANPDDARTQIQRAIEDHRQRFGQPPRGMWPSEGSVSPAAAQLIMESGLRWIGTDEAILAHSLPHNSFTRDAIYEPYRYECGGKSLAMFFRDHELSDAIGFVYTSWNAPDAVSDLMKRLHGIRDRLREKDGASPRPHVVPIILDGENCWEYYHQDGRPFLRQLYQALSDDPAFRTVRGTDYLDEHPPSQTLTALWSGSWINANFAIWLGHREDNLAWDLLFRTREFLVAYLKDHPERSGSAEANLAWEEIYIAEGSDWCWWYGEDHSSANDQAFDYLFRKHLMNVYTVLGAKVPDDLRVAIKPQKTRLAPTPPIDFITPKIDGKVTSYFEWQAAGIFQTDPGATGTMHRAQSLIKTIYYGYDLQNLHFRLDLSKPLSDPALDALTLKVVFIHPEAYEIVLKIRQGVVAQFELLHKPPNAQPEIQKTGQVGIQKVIEFSVPLSQFAWSKQPFEWIVLLEKDSQEQERWPPDSAISYPYPSEENFAQSWIL